MKSTEVYKILREEIGPWSKAHDFKPTKTLLSWFRPIEDRNLVFWFQISRDGWDAYAGSKFTVEFQISKEPIVGAAAFKRQRIGKLLTDSALEELLKIQNSVIGSLHKPQSDHPFLQESTREWYLQKFQLLNSPYQQNSDIWLRYHTADHIRSWGQFVLRQLPACLEQMERQS
jgi:hypothetical protein